MARCFKSARLEHVIHTRFDKELKKTVLVSEYDSVFVLFNAVVYGKPHKVFYGFYGSQPAYDDESDEIDYEIELDFDDISEDLFDSYVSFVDNDGKMQYHCFIDYLSEKHHDIYSLFFDDDGDYIFASDVASVKKVLDIFELEFKGDLFEIIQSRAQSAYEKDCDDAYVDAHIDCI